MGQIATKGWIYENKRRVPGWSGDNKCPTKSEIESADPFLGIARPIYASNQLVQQSDIKIYDWKYYFSVSPTFIQDNGAGGTYTFYVDSRRVRTIDGVETDTQEYVEWTFSENIPWVSGEILTPLTSHSRLGVTITGGYQTPRSGTISFQQVGSSNTFLTSVSQAGRYILRYVGHTSASGIGLFNSASAPRSGIDYPYMRVSLGSGTLVTYGDSGFTIADVMTGNAVTAYLGDTIYVREKTADSWELARQVTLMVDSTVYL